MPVTDSPKGVVFPVWSTGSKTETTPYGSGSVKRVTPEDDISARDTNSLRNYVEALAIHVHDYKDNIGSC